MSSSIVFKDAVSGDSRLLSELAFVSKSHWAYPVTWMELWRPDLEVSETYISENKVVKMYEEQELIGFYGLKKQDPGVFEIDHLWLIPEKIKKGYGKQLFLHSINYLQSLGQKTVHLTADPNAKGFYDKMGGRVVGQLETKISGRVLDIYEFTV